MSMSWDFHQLRTDVDLVGLIMQRVPLTRRGSRWWGQCPFHDDRHPSFEVSPGHHVWRCWVCNVGGDAIDWVRLTENCSTIEAIHRLEGTVVTTPAPPPLPAPDPLASRVRRHAAFQALLQAAGLRTDHHQALRQHGLSDGAIAQAGYASLPSGSRHHLIAAMLRAVPDLRGIPGVSRRVQGRGWKLQGAPGLLIPVRDHAGRIQGCQIRRDSPGARYQWLTSTPHDEQWTGASPGSPFHVAGQAYVTPRSVWWVTEGPLKADVAAFFLHQPVLGLPGITVWPKLARALSAWHPVAVVLAFDQDGTPDVRQIVQSAQNQLAALVAQAGIAVRLARWAEGPKGVDDALQAGLMIRTTRWPPFHPVGTQPTAPSESRAVL